VGKPLLGAELQQEQGFLDSTSKEMRVAEARRPMARRLRAPVNGMGAEQPGTVEQSIKAAE